MKAYLLGIDNGLTATKAVLYDLRGTQLGIASLPTRPLSDQTEHSEIDMTHQWRLCCSVIRQVLKQTAISPADIAAIGVSGYGNGLHLLDKAGRPLGKGITSMDHRASDLVATFPEQHRKRLQELTLQDIWDGQPGMLARWMKINQSELYGQINAILLCKDWIQYRLTGKISTEYTDISAAGLLNNRTKAYDDTILELLDIPEMQACLPDVLESAQVAGTITHEAALQTGLSEGIPVVGGLFDVTANAIGSGLIRPGQLCMIAGTWNINIALGRRAFIPKNIRQCTIYGDSDVFCYIDSSATSASNLEWFLHQVLNKSCRYEEFERVIAEYAPEDVDVLFLPFVHSGLKSDHPGAMFYGLKSIHGRNEMLRAIAEGIGFAHAYHIQNLQSEGIEQGDTVFFTGGASRNKQWCQMFADILQLNVAVPAVEQTGTLGDCIVTGVGAGIFPTIQKAITQMVSVREVYEPRANYAEGYRKKYGRFVDLLNRMIG